MVGHAGAHPAPPSWSQARCRQREKCQTKNESGNKAKKISPADVVPAWTNYLECKINRFPFYPDAQPSASDVGIKLVQGNIPPLLISKSVFFDDKHWIVDHGVVRLLPLPRPGSGTWSAETGAWGASSRFTIGRAGRTTRARTGHLDNTTSLSPSHSNPSI